MSDLREVYDRQAADWDRARTGIRMEQGWLARLIEGLPAGAEALDLGCGSGAPIAAWLVEQGLSVTGVDFSAAMLSLARERLPGQTWIEADMRALAMGRRFDAVIAWDSFFHLAPDDQRAMFPVFRDHLRPGGRLLLTTGDREGEAWGQVGGEPVWHASLSPDAYRALMAGHGLEVVDHVARDPECGDHTVWLARRR